MWQMKRQPAGRILSSFLALLLVITTVLNPICSMPSYATESPVKLSYGHVDEKGVEIFVESDNESFAPGEDIALNLYIQNLTEEALTGGILSVNANSAVTGVLLDSTEESLTEIALEPGEVREVAFSGIVSDELELHENAEIGFSFTANKAEGTVNGQTEFKFTTDLITFRPVEISENGTLEAGKSYTMTLTLDLSEDEEWVKVIQVSKENESDLTEATPSAPKATPSEPEEMIKELISAINFTMNAYGTEFSKAEIKNVDVDYSNYMVEATVAFTVEAAAKAGESFGTVTALVKLDDNEKYRVSQCFGYEVEGAVVLTEEELAEVQRVIEMIEELPTRNEVMEETDVFFIDDGTEEGYFDAEGYDAYMAELAEEVLPVYEAYMELNAKQKDMVPEEAFEKLMALYDMCGDITVYAEETRKPISNITPNENIKIHLFNYGSHINDDEIRVLDFNNGSTNTTAGATKEQLEKDEKELIAHPTSYYYIDGHGVYDERIYSYRPIMAKTLGEDGYPLVLQQEKITSYTDTKDANGKVTSTTYHTETLDIEKVQKGLISGTDGKKSDGTNYGSLKYLFDKDSKTIDGTGNITYKDVTKRSVEYFYNRSSGYTSSADLFNPTYGYTTKYRTKHYDLEGDGGLFQIIDGYYQYDSRENAAYYNERENEFEVYDHLIAPGHTATNPGNDNWVNFFPFNKPLVDTTSVQDSGNRYIESDGSVTASVRQSDGTYEDEVRKNPTGKEVYILSNGSDKVDCDNDLTTPEEYVDKSSSLADTWFGMSMEFDFFIPKDGKIDGRPLEFEFAGDDDVWVYIDDVLILDIGGCHGAQNGTINFATGVVNTPTSSTDNTSIPSTTLRSLFKGAEKDTSNFDGDTFADYTSHKLKFFYMERGGNISYCKLKFNLPTLPPNSLMVTKQVDDYGTYFADKNMDYTFRVVKETTAGGKESILEKATFKIYENGVDTNQTGNVENDGTFKLKKNQSALFSNMISDGDYQYYVEEIIPENEKAWYSKVEYSLGGENAFREISLDQDGPYQTEKINAAAANVVIFKNTPKLGDLVITKEVVGVNRADMDNYSVDVTIVSDMLASDSNCKFALDIEYDESTKKWIASKVVKGLPEDTYTITETVNNEISEKLDVEYAACQNDIEVQTVSVSNSKRDEDAASVTFTNRYALRSLTISKDMYTEDGKPYLAEKDLPDGTTFTFDLKATENSTDANISKLRYQIIGSVDAVTIDGTKATDTSRVSTVRAASDGITAVYEMDIDKSEIEIKLEKPSGENTELPSVKIIKIPEGRTYTIEEKEYLKENAPVGNVSSELVDVTHVGGTEKPNGAIFEWKTANDREKSVTFVNNFQWNAKVNVTKNVTNANEAPDREFMIQIVNEDGTYVDTATVLKHGETSGTIRVDKTTALVVTETKVKEFHLIGITATRKKLDSDGNATAASENVSVTVNGNKYELTVDPGYVYEIQVNNTYSEEPYFHDDDGKMNEIYVDKDGATAPVERNNETAPTSVAMMIESRFLNRKEDEFEVQDDTTAVV